MSVENQIPHFNTYPMFASSMRINSNKGPLVPLFTERSLSIRFLSEVSGPSTMHEIEDKWQFASFVKFCLQQYSDGGFVLDPENGKPGKIILFNDLRSQFENS